MRTEEYGEAAQAFAEAGVDGAAWLPALRRLASATRSSRAELLGLGANALSFSVSELPEVAYREFEAVGGHSRWVSPRIAAAARAAPMQVVGDPEYDEVTPLLRSDAYLDVVRKYDIEHGCQTTLLLQPDRLIGLCVLRTRREGRSDPEATAAFAALAPHVLAAVRTRLALGEVSVRGMLGGLEHAEVAAFLCDADGTVRAMTGRAEQLLLGPGPLALRERRLTATQPQDEPVLQRSLAAAGARTDGAESVVLGLDGLRAAIHVRALGAGDWGLLFQPRLLVIVRQGPSPPSADVLRLAFGLTPAEAEIALALAAGQPRDLIAAQRGVTLGTLRQQVKAVFAKAGVGREAELILAVHGLG